MIVTVLMAGYDADAKEIFDGYYNTYRNWPSSDHPDLMSWAVPADGNLLESHRLPSATDGDMDVAYALILASEQWGGSPEGFSLSYRDAAIKIIKALEQNNILYEPEGYPLADDFPRLGIGNNDPVNSNYWGVRATRSSDFMLSHFRVFHAVRKSDKTYVDGTVNEMGNVWSELERSVFAIVDRMQNQQTGLMPDFMGNYNGDFSQPISTFKGISDEPYGDPGKNDDSYWYNACRFPWRFAQGFIHDSIPEAREKVQIINEWVLTADAHMAWGWFQDTLIQAGYTLDGYVLSGGEYYDKAFASPFMTAMSLSEESWYFNAMWNTVSQFTEPSEWSSHYYDNTVTLLNLLLLSGNWWKPTVDATSLAVGTSLKQKQDISIRSVAGGNYSISGLLQFEKVNLVDIRGRSFSTLTANSAGVISLSVEAPGIYYLKSKLGNLKLFLK